MEKVKSTIPVLDICTLDGAIHKDTDLIAMRFSDYLKRYPNLPAQHGHSFYHFLLFTSGGGYRTIDFEKLKVAKGQIYFMAPGQVHSWSFEGDMEGYVVNFADDFFRSFLADAHYLEQFPFLSGNVSECVVQLSPETLKLAGNVLDRVVAETEQHKSYSADMIRTLLLSLFMHIARVQNTGEKKPADVGRPNSILLQQFRKLLNEYYSTHKLPKDYAAMLYITPNHLNALCQDFLGKSAGQIIRERVLLEAKRRLVNAGNGIANIGYELGFSDNSYFTKFFKKYTGITPEEFKKNNR
jgi:AraC-like DNA-binding protein